MVCEGISPSQTNVATVVYLIFLLLKNREHSKGERKMERLHKKQKLIMLNNNDHSKRQK